MQTEDFRWFLANYNDLFHRYGVCYLAIRNKTVLGSYQTPKEAIANTEKIFPVGSFIVQLCNGSESGYTNFIANTQISVI